MSEFQDIVLRALEKSQSLGAQKARISAYRGQSLSMSWRKNKVENMTSAGESQLSLTLFVDGRYGNYSTSDMRTESVEAFIARCIDITRLLEADSARDLADPSRYENRCSEDLETYDPASESMTPSAMIDYCRNLEALTYAHNEIPITEVSTEFAVEQTESFMATTNGFSGSRRGTIFSGATSIVLSDGEKKPSDYGVSYARYLSDLRSPQEIADEAARYGAMKLGQKKLASGNRTIILDSRVSSQMIRKYLTPLSGMSLVMKSSYFMDKIGEKVACERLDLRDEPWMKRGIGSMVYDGEGMSTKPTSIFDKGVLRQYFLNVYAANKLNMVPTIAHYSNLVLTPGARSLESMIADVKDGIYVTGLLGGNQDNVRGDFSHGIVGVAIENGALTTPISEMNITGNHTDLWHRLSEVGNDVRVDTMHRIPSVRLDDVAVSGN